MTITSQPHLSRLRRLRSWIAAEPTLAISLAALCVLALAGVLAPVVAPAQLGSSDLTHRLQAPSWQHPFGTDDLGMDVLSQTLYGLRTSLYISVTATVICSVIGIVLGAAAGWLGGRIDTVVSFFVDVQSSLPAFILALGAVAFFGGSPLTLIIVLSLQGWERIARVVRAQTMAVRQSTYVDSSLALGVHPLRVVLRHLLPAIAGPTLVQVTLALPVKIIIESSLSFLGLGIQPPDTSLGQIIGEGRDYLTNAWWISLFPGLFIVILGVAVGLIGDRLQDRMVDRDTR